jgi:glycosyltransferase involved in cell wall biosynthesis
MNILYHMTNLPPKLPGTEASLQELNTLKEYFGGEVVFVNPNQASPVYLPRLLFGFHLLKQIRAKEAQLQAHHLYNADPFPFPFLRRLKRPVIYSVSSGVGRQRPNIEFFNSLAAITVADERSLQRLQVWGIKNVHLVRPGIKTEQFSHTPLTFESEIKLMVGSAPWTERQFQSKGLVALLELAQQMPNLRLVCLWRNVLTEQMERRVRQLGLEKRVELINKKVDVNQILAGVHASITLVTDPAIIRSYPHTLMESLAAGKPVIISRSIPMADYVERNGCGTIAENVTPQDISGAIETLIRDYRSYQQNAQHVGASDFTEQKMIDSFKQVYGHVLNN